MGKIVAVESVSLDGVMQAPGRPEEDRRGGFAHGGWAVPYNDAVMFQEMGAGMAESGPMLFGRRTYEDFYDVWHGRTDNPFSSVLDNGQKYVASTTLKAPLNWQNSTLIGSDTAAEIRRLKAESPTDIAVLGSGELVRFLLAERLLDVFVLLVHPLVLGQGRRLFPDAGVLAAFDLVRAVPTTTGVVIATYRRKDG